MNDVLRVRDLGVRFDTEAGEVTALDGLSFSLGEREILAVVGESGSGKSTMAMSVLRLLGGAATVSGSVELEGEDVLALRGEELRRVRGKRAAMIFQEPMTALNPLQRIGAQIAEALRNHDPEPERLTQYRDRVRELLERVEIDDPDRRMRQYPHQLSGGQRQRVLIAMAIGCEPRLLIADEPTTALDVTVQAGILDLLRRIRDESGTAILLITHNMGVVADIADRILVLRAGKLVEQANSAQLFAAPEQEYTRELLEAVPLLGGRAEPSTVDDNGPALELERVTVRYGGGVKAVDEVSLRVGRGELLGLVGESGSGKSTIGGCALGLVRPESGAVRLFGTDPNRAKRREALELRRRIGVVFQDPGSSLDPRMTIGQCIAEPLLVHREGTKSGRAKRIAELLDAVELGAGVADRFPHELSGGQRQRVSLARALVLGPDLLIADEPTSALDVSVQATVLALLARLHQELFFGCLFISHDLAVVDNVCDRVAVLNRGRVVEQGERTEVLGHPSEDYTRRLVLASPVPDPVAQAERRRARTGEA
ncbi:dipeptide ABC transporter ATP-binding protein [Sciscionella marina]|uniref:dipeptide ABC transporter ATP-binding protein n=1 Tax=Sciscionella marina TaxID=508770 RepID=UPI00035F84B8|nr:ABC transporter ATP-binding protein [Sciscionella marina]